MKEALDKIDFIHTDKNKQQRCQDYFFLHDEQKDVKDTQPTQFPIQSENEVKLSETPREFREDIAEIQYENNASDSRLKQNVAIDKTIQSSATDRYESLPQVMKDRYCRMSFEEDSTNTLDLKELKSEDIDDEQNFPVTYVNSPDSNECKVNWLQSVCAAQVTTPLECKLPNLDIVVDNDRVYGADQTTSESCAKQAEGGEYDNEKFIALDEVLDDKSRKTSKLKTDASKNRITDDMLKEKINE